MIYNLNLCDCSTTVTVYLQEVGGIEMMSLEEYANILSDFGLTHNQAKAYIATVQLGVASISEVSKVSKVRREDVYRMLPKLNELGLIEKLLGKPAKIRATPVEEALSILIKREKEIADKKLSALQAKKDAFLKNFNNFELKPRIEEETRFSLITDRRAVISKGMVMLKNAERTVDIITSKNAFNEVFTIYSEIVEKTIRRGIRYRIVLDATEFDDPILKILEEYESPKKCFIVKSTDQPLIHCTIMDYKEALIATSQEPTTGRNPYLWTNDHNLIEILQKNFERVWHTSTKTN